MIKKIIKAIGLFTLIGFSFFYTDKVIEVIQEEDKVMIELQNVKDTYKVEPINASITENTMIPGLNGRKINIDKSYKNMKGNGIFNNRLIAYDTITPEISMKTNKDKFIILGNNNKQMISLVFILNNNKNLEKIEEMLENKGATANYFVDYKYLINHSTKIKELENREFYSYGDNGEYTPDNLLFSSNLISRISNNNAIFCLSDNMDNEILDLCYKNDLYTIVPNIIGGDTPYASVKENLSSGSIILLSMNNDTIKELPTILDYIKGKGYKISGLSKLLTEEL